MNAEQQLVEAMSEEIGREVDREIWRVEQALRAQAPWYKQLWWRAQDAWLNVRRRFHG